MTTTLRLAAAAAVILSLAGCVVETPAPVRPAPVVMQPAPATGTVVVQPQP